MTDSRLHYRLLFKDPPRWRGIPILKFPSDLILYAQVIYENQPDFIVETGTQSGGSACFFADVLNLDGEGHVVTIDLNDLTYCTVLDHPNITYLRGSSIDPRIVAKVRDIVGNGSVMVSLDSNHTSRHVRRELWHYSKIVTRGQYLVVEDLCDRRGNIRKNRGPAPAVELFLEGRRNRRYRRVPLEEQFAATVTKYGWLRG